MISSDKLSAVEEQIATWIYNNKDSQIRLLEQLVNINSETYNLKGVLEVGEILVPLFNDMNFITHWSPLPPEVNRAGALIAMHQGNSGKRLLLIGHLDTVVAKDEAFKFEKLQDNIIKGPGVVDDKGGCVTIVAALQALHAMDVLKNASITVILTGDEEDTGQPIPISRKSLFELAKNCDIALDFEGAPDENIVLAARRGIAEWIITTQGVEKHSSKIFTKEVGHGAIFELARILNTMPQKLSMVEGLSFNPGSITGGAQGNLFGKTNIVAGSAYAKGEYRFLNNQQKEYFQEQLLEIVQQHLPGTDAQVVFEDAIPPMSSTPDSLQLVKLYSNVSEDLGYGPVEIRTHQYHGAADICYIADLVSGCLGGLGPLGENTHTNEEIVELDSLVIQTQRAALLISRLVHN